MTTSPHTLSLTAAAAAIRSGGLTSVEYTRALLERIAATDANVQAWAHLDSEQALAAAGAIDRAREPGVEAGPLGGIGVGVKDIVATADQPTQMGSPIHAGARPAFDAECVVRLKRAGAFVLGKTVTTEFAFMHAGKTRNPWHAAHTPGGSSSGSAAAVAIGQVPAAIGTQTNGSVIRPAAYCGVAGFKPTLGALPFAGVNRFSPTFDTLGVFARTVTDCALLASCLADAGRLSPTPPALERPPRLALVSDFPWTKSTRDASDALDACATRLRRQGAEVTAVALPEALNEANLVHRCIMFYEAAQELGGLQARERARLSAELNAALDEGARYPGASYRDALASRGAIIDATTAWLAPFDAVISPPAPGPAPADLTQTGDPSYCTLWSLAGFPAISIAVGLAANGLPLAMQLAAPAGCDDHLLAVAGWCEGQLPFRGLV